MSKFSEQEIEALLQPETNQVFLPSGAAVKVTATRHHWLAYEELLTTYGWQADEFLRLVELESETTGRDFDACFRGVVAYTYADARHEMAEQVGASLDLPLLLSGYRGRDDAGDPSDT